MLTRTAMRTIRAIAREFVFLSGLFLINPSSAQTLHPLPDEELLRAEALENEARFPDAETALRSYLQQHPGSARAMYDLGKALHYQNRPKDSLASYTAAAALSPPATEDLRVVALDYVLLADYSDAARWLNRALQNDPADAELWYDLGRTRMMQLDFTAAETALRQSLALSPLLVKAENNLGVTYEALNRSTEALKAYQQAIAWQRESPYRSEQPLLNYGKLLVDQNRVADALPSLQAAVEIAPNNPKCREQLARALSLSGKDQVDRAQMEMREAIRLDPLNARLHFQLGILYRKAGKLDLAKEQLDLSGKLYGSHATDPDK